MALALHLFLLLLLAVALPARAAQAAPLQARGADWHERNVFLAPWLEDSLDPVEPPTGVSAERNFQTPGLVAAHKPGSHRRGPPKGNTQAKGENKSLKPSELLDQMLSDLERRHEMKGEAVQNEAFPRGSSDSVPASAAGREAMPGTVPGDWDPEMDYLEVLAHNHFKPLDDAEAMPAGEGDTASQPMSRTEPLGDGEVRHQEAGQKEIFPQGSRGQLAAPASGRKAVPDTDTGTGGSAGPTTSVPDSQKGLGSGFCKGTRCLLELMAIVGGGELIVMLCCFGIWYSWKRKRHHLEEKLKAGGWSRDLYSQKSNSSSSESGQFSFAPRSSAVL